MTGGLRARDKNLAIDPDFYRKIGAKGGRNGTRCGILAVVSIARPIKNHEEYQVLDTGVILGISGRPMKPQFDAKGYLRIQVKDKTKANGVATLKLHRVVAEAFLPNPSNLPQVDHLDGDKSNGDVSNLEWVTNEENQRRALERGVYDSRLPKEVMQFGGQVLTAISNGYVAADLFDNNGIGRKTFWRAVERGIIQPEPITTLELGRKKKYYYYDASRRKWRVERSDAVPTGKQFDTKAEAAAYAAQAIVGGFGTNRELARIAGARGGRISRRLKRIKIN